MSLVLLLLGCEAYDSDLLQKSEGFGARRITNTTTRDAGSCSGGSAERCNASDDDCDGEIDEGAESDCMFAHGTAVCVRGDCVIVECEGGYADCNRSIEDGCEQRSDAIACGMCGKVCPGSNPGTSSGATGGDPDRDDDDDESDAGEGEDPCSASEERCDGEDNDCDGNTDEGTACAVAMCAASTPSYRGEACDGCVCESCPQLVALCQNHPDATWSAQCRALIECVVIHSRMGECPNADCYINGTGPCAAETNIAAGGADGNDGSQVVVGCAAAMPPSAPCAAAVNYRDQCTTTLCSSVCTQ